MFYKIVSDTEVSKMEDKVNGLMSQGWHPLGIMQVVPMGPDTNSVVFYQAMVKVGTY